VIFSSLIYSTLQLSICESAQFRAKCFSLRPSRSHTAPPASQRFPLPIFINIYTLAACRGWNKKSWLMYALATHIEREKERERIQIQRALLYFLPFHILLHIRAARIIYLTYTDCNKWSRPGPLQLCVEKWGVCWWESDASSHRQHSTFEPSIIYSATCTLKENVYSLLRLIWHYAALLEAPHQTLFKWRWREPYSSQNKSTWDTSVLPY
jgi:hypothetical protein